MPVAVGTGGLEHASQHDQSGAPAGQCQQQAGPQPGCPPAGGGNQQRLPTKQADADRRITAAWQLRLCQPAREHGEQEAEDETGQYQVLHQQRVQPGRRQRRWLRRPQPAQCAQPQRPPQHCQQQVAGADEEQQPVRRAHQHRRGGQAGHAASLRPAGGRVLDLRHAQGGRQPLRSPGMARRTGRATQTRNPGSAGVLRSQSPIDQAAFFIVAMSITKR